MVVFFCYVFIFVGRSYGWVDGWMDLSIYACMCLCMYGQFQNLCSSKRNHCTNDLSFKSNRVLGLAWNNLKDEGACAFAESIQTGEPGHLKKLDMGNNSIGDSGVSTTCIIDGG